MEILGIPSLLAEKPRELRNSDRDLQELAAIALSNRKEIKTVMGIGLAKNSSPILILRRFLEKIDYSLKYLRCESQDKGRKRIRIYQIMSPEDPRRQVFYHWFKRDQNLPGSSLFWEQDKFKIQLNSSLENHDKFLQLSLDL